MSLIASGSIHEGHEWFSDDSRGRQDIFMCLAALLCDVNFCKDHRDKIEVPDPLAVEFEFLC